MPDGDKYTRAEFAGLIRSKYPGAYKDKGDDELVDAWLTKYPVYKDRIAPTPLGFSGFYKSQNTSPIVGKPTGDMRPLTEDEMQEKGYATEPQTQGNYIPDENSVMERYANKARSASHVINSVLLNSDHHIRDEMVAEGIKQYRDQMSARQDNYMPDAPAPVMPKLFYDDKEVAEKKKQILASADQTRTLLRDIADKSPEEQRRQIQRAMRTVDIANSFKSTDGESRLIKAERDDERISSGENTYDIKHGKLIKPENFLTSIASGWNQKEKALDDFKTWQGMSDAELAGDLNKRIASEDHDAPVGMPNNAFSSFARGVGSQPVSALAAGALTSLGGAPEAAPYVSALVGGSQMGAITYGAALPEFYKQFLAKGLPPEQAAHEARALARNQGLTDAAVGTLMMAAGGKLGAGSLPKFSLAGGFKTALEEVVSKSVKYLGESVGEAGGIGSLSVGGQHIKNALANKAGLKTDSEAGVGEALEGGVGMVLGMKLAHAVIAKGGEGVSKAAFGNLKDGASRLTPEQTKSILQQLVDEGHLSQEKADAAMVTIDKERQLNASIDASFPGITDEARAKAKVEIEKRDALDEKKAVADKSIHPDIKDKIDKANENIIETGEDRAKPLTAEVRDKLKTAGYTDEEIDHARPSEVEELLAKKTTPTVVAEEKQPEVPETKPVAPTTTEETPAEPVKPPEKPAEPKVEVKMHERVPMENPVHRVTIDGEDHFIQRSEGMNPGDTAWYEVVKGKDGWEMAEDKGSYILNDKDFRGYTKQEAVDNLVKRHKAKPAAEPKQIEPYNDELFSRDLGDKADQKVSMKTKNSATGEEKEVSAKASVVQKRLGARHRNLTDLLNCL